MEQIRIAPVAKGYFASMKVTLADIARKRRAGIAVFAERHNPDGSITQVFLIPEGTSIKTKEGEFLEAVNLKTKRPYGQHQVLAKLKFSMKRGFLEIDGIAPATAAYADALDLEAVAFEVA